MTDLTVEAFLVDESAGLERIHENWEDVPLLEDVPNHDVLDGSLFRFRGMIQDMPNPVFYFSEYAVQNVTTGVVKKRCGKFRSSLVCEEGEKLLLDEETSVSSERRPYYCVSVPGLNSWARLASRTRQELPMKEETSSVKRPADDMEVDDESQVSSGEGNKRLCAVKSPSETSGMVTDLHCPIPTGRDAACVVHIYDVDDNLKVNDVVDVVGFVYVSGADQDDVDVPPSLAPRLHAVAVRRNPSMTINVDVSPSVRSDLHLALTQLLLGDHLAADYLICHLLSNVYSRRDVVLGKFSLNLCNVPLDPLYTSGLYDILASLVPRSHFFPMSLHNMNTSDLVPVKDYNTNRLKTGLLQLSDRTHFVIDETKLDIGKLQQRGVQNVQVLNTLLSDQTVNYDFKFYNVPFHMNIPVMVLSEGKSLLHCDAVVRLTPDGSFAIAETLEAVRSYLKEPLLSHARRYLSESATQEFVIPDDLTAAIQNDFVEMRRIDSKITPDEMHTHLVLARLLALSHGQNVLTKDIWDRASELERLRRARL
uniref:Mini-chromosome maintenance complex-binding protein n=1 Tax=Lygus hesperus TaxID=30085 RepID=A0A146LVX7_LYGHE